MKGAAGVAGVLACMAGLLVADCGGRAGAPAAPGMGAVPVRVAQVEARVHERAQWLPGTVHPWDQATIASKLMATVAEEALTIGQRVKEGETLLVLRADEIDAQVEQARAALAQVERNYAREQSLLRQSATTAEAVRTLEDEMRLAKARLSEALTMQDYKNIRAPFDGMVTSKGVRRGDLAVPGQELLRMEGTGSHMVHLQVPDSLSALPHGALVRIEADGAQIEGRVAEWSPAADPASRTRLAKLQLAGDAAVRSGQYVRVYWPAGAADWICLPEAALSVSGQMERVFTVSDGRARLRLVRTGARDGAWVQVLAGLSAGETVVLAPPAILRDGQPVEVQP